MDIKKGDKIKVMDWGHMFDTYTQAAKDVGLTRFVYGDSIPYDEKWKGTVVTVVGENDGRIGVELTDGSGRQYVVGRSGVDACEVGTEAPFKEGDIVRRVKGWNLSMMTGDLGTITRCYFDEATKQFYCDLKLEKDGTGNEGNSCSNLELAGFSSVRVMSPKQFVSTYGFNVAPTPDSAPIYFPAIKNPTLRDRLDAIKANRECRRNR